MDNEFEKVKKAYNDLRNSERQKIVKKLLQKGFKASGRQGTYNYTSRGNLEKSYNLGIWKWIIARRDDITVVIDLQAIEQDSRTQNIHVLFDRISIDVFNDDSEKIISESNDSYFKSIQARYNVKNVFDSAFVEKAITDLELPLGEDDLENLINIIEARIEKLN